MIVVSYKMIRKDTELKFRFIEKQRFLLTQNWRVGGWGKFALPERDALWREVGWAIPKLFGESLQNRCFE